MFILQTELNHTDRCYHSDFENNSKKKWNCTTAAHLLEDILIYQSSTCSYRI